MSFAYLVSLLLLGSIAFALVREMRKASPPGPRHGPATRIGGGPEPPIR